MEEIKSGDVVKVDVSDLGEDYSRLKGEDTAYFRVSIVSNNLYYGTFRKGNYYFKGKIGRERIIEKDDYFVWRNI